MTLTFKDITCLKKYIVHQKHNDVFLKYGFTFTIEYDTVVPRVCGMDF